MRKLLSVVACGVLGAGCSGNVGPVEDPPLAAAQSEADAAASLDAGAPPLDACALLTRAEVEAAIGPFSAPPQAPPEDSTDTAEGRCVWHGAEGRTLVLGASGEGGTERLGAIEPYAVVGPMGRWEQARLQGCCLLHATGGEAMVSLDFSAARLALAQAAKLVDLALPRVHEPLESP